MKKTIDRSDVKTRSKFFSSTTCPHCSRRFGPKAADKHIQICKEKSKDLNKKNQSAKK